MHEKRVVFLGYGDLSPNKGGKSKEIFYITKGLYENGLLGKSLVRDFEKGAVAGLKNVLIRPIPFGNLIPKSIGAFGKILKVNINNRYYSERLFSLCAKRWLIKNKDKYDVVLGTVRLTEAFETAKDSGKTTVLYVTGEHPLSFKEKYENEIKKRGISKVPSAWSDKHLDAYIRSIELSDYIIALSHESKKTYVKRGCESSKIYVCPLGTDAASAPITEQRANSNNDKFVVVFMGRIDVAKGVQYLLEAWRQARLPKDAVLYVCGKHPRGAHKITNRFKELENVYYPGFVDSKEYFQKADIFVLPTLSEGFPRSVLDAMSYGLPGIVTPIASEPIVHGENGLIVPYCDSESIAHWLRKLYKDREMCKRLGSEAGKVARKYSWEGFSNNIASTIIHIMALRQKTLSPKEKLYEN